MTKEKWTLASPPNDTIPNVTSLVSPNNKQIENDRKNFTSLDGSTISKLRVLFYYEWEFCPAVIVKNENGEYVKGFFLRKEDKWTCASIPQLLDFVKEGREISLDTFEARFGRIGRDLPVLVL